VSRAAHPLTFTIALLLGVAGCSKGSTEAAPVQGGETLTYRFDGTVGMSTARITITARSGGFTVGAEPIGGFSPVDVGPDLADGRDQLKLYYLGRLWLEPSARKVGAKTVVGDVKEQTTWSGWPVWVVAEHGGASGKRYFHRDTGFLVGMQISVGGGGYRAQLVGTNMDGMNPSP
jgi:hypothetical protein